MHDDEFIINKALINKLLSQQFPSISNLSIKQIKHSGTDNAIFRLDNNYAARLPRILPAAEQIKKEITWLPKLQPLLPFSTPELIKIGAPSNDYPYHWYIYNWIEGKNAYDEKSIDYTKLAKELANFINSLQKICFRKMEAAARKGNWRLAKTRRPVDLWLSEEEATMPAARGLYVDLRPLARGGFAVGLPFGSMDSSKVDTDISVTGVTYWGRDFADLALIGEASRGMSDDSTVPAGTLLCAPHVGALKSFEVAMSKLAKSVTEGWASNYEEVPCWPIRCAAYSVVDESAKTGKAKFRLTNDLSWPKPGAILGVDSLNDSMDRSKWSGAKLIKVSQVGEGIAILKASGGPVKAWGFDMAAYNRKFGRRPDELWHQAMYGSNGFQLDTRCQFGDASVAVKCSRFSNLIAATIRTRLEKRSTPPMLVEMIPFLNG